jgi:hypothetical protein
VTAALLLACSLLALVPAKLVPPGGRPRGTPAESLGVRMPAALSGPARRTGRTIPNLPTRVAVSPVPARLGERMTYRASMLVGLGTRVRFDRPAPGGEFTWGTARTGRTSVNSSRFHNFNYGGVDSVWMEIPLQVFSTGRVSIPGPAVEVVEASGAGGRTVTRLPTVHLIVLPTITAADSNARLRALHGPLPAPWWERVPWTLVAAVAMLLAALVGLIVLLRRRKPAAPAPVAARPQPARDPGAEALAQLARLRAQRLPEAGRFAEHALALTFILRRYLEAVVGTPRPGDTSGELVARLRQSRLSGDDVTRLEGLLGLWDRVKFARAPLGVEEAGRCEFAVEALVRRRAAQEVA